jgi:hypothetical protein
MAYIRIANKAPFINRLLLEKLGLSTKRDDSDTIGQFGSGSKFAPIAALRKGWRWINVGTDELGPYQMEYVSQKENDIDCVYYKYTFNNKVTHKPSSFTLDAGVLSWDDNFQIFREAFANALDEKISKNAEYSITIEDNIFYVEDEFAVYLTASPELLEIVENFDTWFSINRKPLFYRKLRGSIFEPQGGSVNIYHKNIHVYGQIHDGEHPSLFDYGLDSVKLNEERRLRDTYYAIAHISELWKSVFTYSSMSDTSDPEVFNNCVKICETILQNIDTPCWEFDHFNDYAFEGGVGWDYVDRKDATALRAAWNKVFGKDTVMMLSSESRFFSAVENIYGKKSVIIDNIVMYSQLKQAGVDTVETLLGDEAEFNFIYPADGSLEKEMFEQALGIVKQYDCRLITQVENIKIFTPSEGQSALLGVARRRDIYLSLKAFASMEELVGVLVHELDHVVTGISDGDTAFRSLADDRIAKLVLERYGPSD